jgi:hypothetical protein
MQRQRRRGIANLQRRARRAAEASAACIGDCIAMSLCRALVAQGHRTRL